MTYDVVIGGRVRTVTVEHVDGGLTASVDGRSVRIDVVPIAGGWSLILDGESRRAREVLVDGADRAGDVLLHVDGAVFRASVMPSGSNSRRLRSSRAAPAAGQQRVVAPMPGRIVRVLVRPGDRVAARQGIVVVEAMKMENELRAAREGTVVSVNAAEGASVEAGAVLVVVE